MSVRVRAGKRPVGARGSQRGDLLYKSTLFFVLDDAT